MSIGKHKFLTIIGILSQALCACATRYVSLTVHWSWQADAFTIPYERNTVITIKNIFDTYHKDDSPGSHVYDFTSNYFYKPFMDENYLTIYDDSPITENKEIWVHQTSRDINYWCILVIFPELVYVQPEFKMIRTTIKYLDKDLVNKSYVKDKIVWAAKNLEKNVRIISSFTYEIDELYYAYDVTTNSFVNPVDEISYPNKLEAGLFYASVKK